MDHISIYDKLKVLGYNYEELAFTNGSGEVLGKLLNGSQKVYNFPALRIHPTIVRGELINELRRQGIPVHYDKKSVSVKEETKSGATWNSKMDRPSRQSSSRNRWHPLSHPSFHCTKLPS